MFRYDIISDSFILQMYAVILNFKFQITTHICKIWNYIITKHTVLLIMTQNAFEKHWQQQFQGKFFFLSFFYFPNQVATRFLTFNPKFVSIILYSLLMMHQMKQNAFITLECSKAPLFLLILISFHENKLSLRTSC